jgi:hypothetical protein
MRQIFSITALLAATDYCPRCLDFVAFPHPFLGQRSQSINDLILCDLVPRDLHKLYFRAMQLIELKVRHFISSDRANPDISRKMGPCPIGH